MGRGGTEAPASTSGRGAGSKGSEQMESAQALLLDAQHHDTEVHNKALAAAFARSQAAAHSQWDLLAGLTHAVLVLLALPSSIHRQHMAGQLAAFVAELVLQIAPACLAVFAREAYLPRRTAILAACRICAALLPRSPLPSRLPPSATGWGGWPQFLLFTGALGANTLPWLARLPFGWFALVHAVCVLDVAAASLPGVCAAPSFLSAPAQQRFAAAARWLRVLALLAPTPNPPKGAGSCLDQLAPVDGAGAPPPLAACACRQMAVWVLLCVGYSLPLAGQYLAETAAWRRFLRTHCRRHQCESCAASKSADLPMLCGMALLMLASFSAVAWQIVAAVYVPPPAALTCAAGALGGECAAAL